MMNDEKARDGSVAYCLSMLTGGVVRAVKNGSLGYHFGTNIPYADGGRWTVTYKSHIYY